MDFCDLEPYLVYIPNSRPVRLHSEALSEEKEYKKRKEEKQWKKERLVF